MKSQKIIIISRTFFPANNPRANRTTELAKELAAQGHEVTVYAVLGSYDYKKYERDNNLKVRDIGPMKYAVMNSGANAIAPTFITKVFSKLFSRLLEFPDIELSFRVHNVLSKLRDDKDLLITIAFPYPIHWGAAYSKGKVKNFPTTWIADCGDPYMGNPSIKRPFYFKSIEKWFSRKVDYLYVPTQNAINAYYPEFHPKIRVVPQGVNFKDYKELPVYEPNKVPTFIYAGAFYPDLRDPRPFLDYLETLESDFKFIIYTKSQNLIQEYKDKLKNKLEIRDFIPKLEVIKQFAKADFLVNFENAQEVQTPSKLIDYALSKRPILSINQNVEGFKVVKDFINGNYNKRVRLENIEGYDIINIAKKFVKVESK